MGVLNDEYQITDGKLVMPYNEYVEIEAGVDKIVNIKRLDFTDGKHLSIYQAQAEASSNEFEYLYTKTDGTTTDFIDEDEFNKATDNGKNLVASYYTDNAGNKYNSDEVDVIKTNRFDDIIKDNPVDTSNLEMYYIKSSLVNYPLTFKQSAKYIYDSSASYLKYNYKVTTEASVSGITLKSDTKTKSENQPAIGSRSVDNAKSIAAASLKTSLATVSASIVADITSQTNKTVTVTENFLDKAPSAELMPTSDEVKEFAPINTTLQAFTAVDENEIVYSAIKEYQPVVVDLEADIVKTDCKEKSVVTPATLSKNGKINYICEICSEQTKASKTISYPKTISLSSSSYTYDGKVKKPSVTVKGADGKTIPSSNYTVTYSSGCKNVGKYNVTIKFNGNYSGSITKSFTINPKNTSGLTLSAQKKGFKASWKKYTTQTTGYEIQYSTSSKFSSPKTVKITKNSTTSKTISKLSAKKKYYVRIRTYKTVSGKTYYSSWSGAKSITTKK